MISLVAQYQVSAGNAETVTEALRRMKALVLEKESGCEYYDICRALDDDHAFLLYEKYRTSADLEAHRETEHFQQIIVETVIPLLADRKPALYDVVG